MASNATILLVGGAFQTTDFYQPLKSALEALGHPVVVPVLPTCSDIDRTQLGKMTVKDDVRVVQAEIESLVNQSKRVVVLLYSYGGQVGSSLNVKDLTTSARKAKGLDGGLECFLWYASAALPENVTFRQSVGGSIPEFDECMPDGTYNFLIAGDTILADLSPADKEKWSAKLIPHSQDVFDHSVSDSAWKYIPSITLVTETDKAIPAQYQEMTAQMVGSKKVVRLSGMGHGAHLACPQELARAVADVLA